MIIKIRDLFFFKNIKVNIGNLRSVSFKLPKWSIWFIITILLLLSLNFVYVLVLPQTWLVTISSLIIIHFIFIISITFNIFILVLFRTTICIFFLIKFLLNNFCYLSIISTVLSYIFCEFCQDVLSNWSRGSCLHMTSIKLLAQSQFNHEQISNK